MLRKIFKWIGILVLVLIVGGASFGAHEWYADKPFMFRAYLDRTPVKIAFQDPEMLTSLGFLKSMGINGHNAHLDDAHPDRTDEFFAELKAYGAGLSQYDDEDLDADQRLSKEITLYLTAMLNDAEQFRFHNYPANQMMGIQSAFPSFMDSSHQVNSIEDAQNYISRISELRRKHEQYLLGLQLREANGIIPPRFVIDRVLDEMRNFVATPAKENILYESLARKLGEAEDIDEAQIEDLLSQAEAQINETVYPAYDLFINYFSELEAKAGSDDGYWHLPNGEAAYKLALRLFTTTDYTADEIHDTGLSEVARIQAEMLDIFESEGIDVSQGYSEAMDAYSSLPEFYYEDSDEGRAQILEDYQTILDDIDANLDDAFNIRPKAGMEVVRVPEFKEETAPGAYYQQPSIDGTRPGRFYANLYDIKATPKFGMRTLAVHEGIPGHHFQVAIAMELEGMPLLRRFSLFTAYVEGWALYAERLAWEQGLMPTPADNIGRLTDQFDIREFHDVVLKNGAVPLDILEKIVDNYIESTLASMR